MAAAAAVRLRATRELLEHAPFGTPRAAQMLSELLWAAANVIATGPASPSTRYEVPVRRTELVAPHGAAPAIQCTSVFPRSTNRTTVFECGHADEDATDLGGAIIGELRTRPGVASAIEDADYGFDVVRLAPEQAALQAGAWSYDAADSDQAYEALYNLFGLAYRPPDFRVHPEYAGGPGAALPFPHDRTALAIERYVDGLDDEHSVCGMASMHGVFATTGIQVWVGKNEFAPFDRHLYRIASNGLAVPLLGRVGYDPADEVEGDEEAWLVPYPDRITSSTSDGPLESFSLAGALRARLERRTFPHNHQRSFPLAPFMSETPLVLAAPPFADVLIGLTWEAAAALASQRISKLTPLLSKAAKVAKKHPLYRVMDASKLGSEELGAHLRLRAASLFRPEWANMLVTSRPPRCLDASSVLEPWEAFLRVGMTPGVVARCLGSAIISARLVGNDDLAEELDGMRAIQARQIVDLANCRVVPTRARNLAGVEFVLRASALAQLPLASHDLDEHLERAATLTVSPTLGRLGLDRPDRFERASNGVGYLG